MPRLEKTSPCSSCTRNELSVVALLELVQLLEDGRAAPIHDSAHARARRWHVGEGRSTGRQALKQQSVLCQPGPSRRPVRQSRWPVRAHHLLDWKDCCRRQSTTTPNRLLAALQPAKIAQAARSQATTAVTSCVQTLNDWSWLTPKVVVSATSAASRPRAMSTRPMRGTLLRASKAYH